MENGRAGGRIGGRVERRGRGMKRRREREILSE